MLKWPSITYSLQDFFAKPFTAQGISEPKIIYFHQRFLPLLCPDFYFTIDFLTKTQKILLSRTVYIPLLFLRYLENNMFLVCPTFFVSYLPASVVYLAF